MNKKIDNSETLRLQETENGYDLIIMKVEKVKLEIENGKILNDLTSRQIEFASNNINFNKK